MKWLGVLVALTLVSPASAELRPLLDSIRQVESGGDPTKVGDGGRSIGAYQIQWAYWKDSGVPGRYEQVRDPRYAERVMLAYWQRYCPESLARKDYQTLARVHNGGPTGTRKSATLPYWRKVLKELRGRDAAPASARK
jgi:hypothetical protein